MLYLGGTIFFSTNHSKVVTKIYCALKIEEILNLRIFFLFSFLQFHNIRETYCKYFENNIFETDISSAAQLLIS